MPCERTEAKKSDPMYEEFLTKNPDFQSIVEALTSGIFGEPKAVLLKAMVEGTAYTPHILYVRAREFVGGEFPVAKITSWAYLNGNPLGKVKGSLYKIGAVVRDTSTTANPLVGARELVAYRKTMAGKEICEPVALLGIRFVNRLIEEGKQDNRSLSKIFGAVNKTTDADYRHGYVVYKVIELLAKNRNLQLRQIDIARESRIPISSIGKTLDTLGALGVIEYISPSARETLGKRARDWAIYTPTKPIRYEEALAVTKRHSTRLAYPELLYGMVEEMNRDIKKGVTGNGLSEKLGYRHINKICKILSALQKGGLLEAPLVGREIHSIAKANKYTILLWDELLEPIGRVANELLEGKTEALEKIRRTIQLYDSDDVLRQHMQNALRVYNLERSRIGTQGGLEIRKLILETLQRERETGVDSLKPGDLSKRVNRS